MKGWGVLDGTFGFSGDKGPATSAQLDFPNDVVVDAEDNLLVADQDNDRVRKGETALMVAQRKGHTEVVKILREAGAKE